MHSSLYESLQVLNYAFLLMFYSNLSPKNDSVKGYLARYIFKCYII